MVQVLKLMIPVLALAGWFGVQGGALGADKAPPGGPAKKINVLVLTGGHAFDKDPFVKTFEGHDDIAAVHVAQKEGGEAFQDIGKWNYDTVVLYNFNQKLPDASRQNLLKLLDRGVGLLVLHHGVGGYTVNWPTFVDVMGGRYYPVDTVENGVKIRSGYKHDVRFKAHIEDANHPITKGMSDFEIVDETYCRYKVDPNVHVLLTTDEPTSEKAIGWVKTYGKARVGTLLLGHGPTAFTNKDFRTVLAQMIRWTAGRLPEGNIEASGVSATTRPAKVEPQK